MKQISKQKLPPKNTRLLWWARLIYGFVALNALVGALILILLPGQTDTLFFWTINPPLNARLFGVLYLGGAAAVFLAVWRNEWEPVRYLVPILVAAGILISWVTLLHLDNFAPGIRTVYWLVIYIGAPLLALLIYGFQERQGANWTVAVPVRPFTRRVALVTGSVVSLVAVGMIMWPETAVAHWPWPTSPLMVRIFAAWFGAFGLGLLWFRVERDWQRLRQIPTLMIAAAGLDLLMVLLHWETLSDTGLTLWLYGGHLLAF
ncbi:MAG: hypothetical protein CL608_03020, partial [Anaerolineaceae bacterium]|nr:hypothetical protein [Anaerolineaceae bacterium]